MAAANKVKRLYPLHVLQLSTIVKRTSVKGLFEKKTHCEAFSKRNGKYNFIDWIYNSLYTSRNKLVALLAISDQERSKNNLRQFQTIVFSYRS